MYQEYTTDPHVWIFIAAYPGVAFCACRDQKSQTVAPKRTAAGPKDMNPRPPGRRQTHYSASGAHEVLLPKLYAHAQ
ncbi:hypothetical protein ROBYS_38390 [Roseobacter sp. OBYS 0001]|nr:hypothetical protein ROBYS_38390 [Roseobacter sp. OBYS 0001]